MISKINCIKFSSPSFRFSPFHKPTVVCNQQLLNVVVIYCKKYVFHDGFVVASRTIYHNLGIDQFTEMKRKENENTNQNI